MNHKVREVVMHGLPCSSASRATVPYAIAISPSDGLRVRSVLHPGRGRKRQHIGRPRNTAPLRVELGDRGIVAQQYDDVRPVPPPRRCAAAAIALRTMAAPLGSASQARDSMTHRSRASARRARWAPVSFLAADPRGARGILIGGDDSRHQFVPHHIVAGKYHLANVLHIGEQPDRLR